MKIFTKLFLSVALLAVYIAGYGANLAHDIKGEGIYIPSNPMAAQNDANTWLGKTRSRLVSSSFVSAFDFASLNAGLAKSLNMPKRYPYNFTANASKDSMLGVRMINTAVVFDEGQLKPTLSAYPNPTRGIIKIQLAQTSNEVYKITLSNTIGQVVKTIKVPESAHNSEIKLDISTYPAGVYFYSLLVNDKMVETKRLILQQ